MDKLKITCSDSFIPEKKYIIETIFGHFLGLQYSFSISNDFGPNYKIELPDNSEILFHDAFFNNFNDTAGFLKKDALPGPPKSLESKFSLNEELILLFGNDDFRQESLENGGIRLRFGADIFASSFFFLTRWEEYVTDRHDEHDRFPCQESYVQRYNLEKRAVVNEYVEFLWHILQSLSYQNKRKNWDHKVVPTHDVDYFRRFDSLRKISRTLLSDLIIRKNIDLFTRDLVKAKKVYGGNEKDPFDTFDYLMNESEKAGCVSEFYFIPAHAGTYDFQYHFDDSIVTDTLKSIIKRGHKVGMHAGYNVMKNPSVFISELKRIKNIVPDIQSNRNHYLRFKVPEVWQVMADNQLNLSSNMGFSNKAGFRSSCCYSYPVFNFHTRKTLDVIEQPIIMMEAALVKEKSNPDDFFAEAISLADEVKKFNGEYVFLWHNSNLNLPEWEPFARRYSEFLSAIV